MPEHQRASDPRASSKDLRPFLTRHRPTPRRAPTRSRRAGPARSETRQDRQRLSDRRASPRRTGHPEARTPRREARTPATAAAARNARQESTPGTSGRREPHRTKTHTPDCARTPRTTRARGVETPRAPHDRRPTRAHQQCASTQGPTQRGSSDNSEARPEGRAQRRDTRPPRRRSDRPARKGATGWKRARPPRAHDQGSPLTRGSHRWSTPSGTPRARCRNCDRGTCATNPDRGPSAMPHKTRRPTSARGR